MNGSPKKKPRGRKKAERPMNKEAVVIGAGLAGCEAALQLADRGIKVTLAEMKPKKHSPAHKSDLFAELVVQTPLKGKADFRRRRAFKGRNGRAFVGLRRNGV